MEIYFQPPVDIDIYIYMKCVYIIVYVCRYKYMCIYNANNICNHWPHYIKVEGTWHLTAIKITDLNILSQASLFLQNAYLVF